MRRDLEKTELASGRDDSVNQCRTRLKARKSWLFPDISPALLHKNAAFKQCRRTGLCSGKAADLWSLFLLELRLFLEVSLGLPPIWSAGTGSGRVPQVSHPFPRRYFPSLPGYPVLPPGTPTRLSRRSSGRVSPRAEPREPHCHFPTLIPTITRPHFPPLWFATFSRPGTCVTCIQDLTRGGRRLKARHPFRQPFAANCALHQAISCI